MTNICFNPAYATSAKIVFKAFPEVEFTTQSFTFPSIRAIYPTQITSTLAVPQPPSAVEYNSFTLNFILQNDLTNYKTIAQWIQSSPHLAARECFSDASVVLLSNQKTPIGSATFVDMMPVNLGPIEYTIVVSDPQPLIATAEFRFLYYEFD